MNALSCERDKSASFCFISFPYVHHYGHASFIYSWFICNKCEKKIDEEVLSVKEEPAPGGHGGGGVSGSPLWRDLSPQHGQRAPWECGCAIKSDIRGEVEGIYLGEVGEVQVL